jgi:hypothetical protein
LQEAMMMDIWLQSDSSTKKRDQKRKKGDATINTINLDTESEEEMVNAESKEEMEQEDESIYETTQNPTLDQQRVFFHHSKRLPKPQQETQRQMHFPAPTDDTKKNRHTEAKRSDYNFHIKANIRMVTVKKPQNPHAANPRKN